MDQKQAGKQTWELALQKLEKKFSNSGAGGFFQVHRGHAKTEISTNVRPEVLANITGADLLRSHSENGWEYALRFQSGTSYVDVPIFLVD